jgi:hypothetical protein
MIRELVKIAAKEAGFEKYHIKNGIYLQPDWATPLKLQDDIAVICSMSLICNISDISKLTTNNIMILKSPENRVDYKHVVQLSEVSGAIQIVSNHISFHKSEIEVDVTSPVWDDIYTGHILYFLIKNPENVK